MRFLHGSLVLALASSGCPGESDASDEGSTDAAADTGEDEAASGTGHACVSNDAFFRERVWGEVLGPLCFECHRAGGEAEQSNFVFSDQDTDPSQQGKNESVFITISKIEFAGEPWSLAKATGTVTHSGGSIFEVDSAEYRILEEMIARVSEPIECP